jgi:hypothetical protein
MENVPAPSNYIDLPCLKACCVPPPILRDKNDMSGGSTAAHFEARAIQKGKQSSISSSGIFVSLQATTIKSENLPNTMKASTLIPVLFALAGAAPVAQPARKWGCLLS